MDSGAAVVAIEAWLAVVASAGAAGAEGALPKFSALPNGFQPPAGTTGASIEVTGAIVGVAVVDPEAFWLSSTIDMPLNGDQTLLDCPGARFAGGGGTLVGFSEDPGAGAEVVATAGWAASGGEGASAGLATIGGEGVGPVIPSMTLSAVAAGAAGLKAFVAPVPKLMLGPSHPKLPAAPVEGELVVCGKKAPSSSAAGAGAAAWGAKATDGAGVVGGGSAEVDGAGAGEGIGA